MLKIIDAMIEPVAIKVLISEQAKNNPLQKVLPEISLEEYNVIILEEGKRVDARITISRLRSAFQKQAFDILQNGTKSRFYIPLCEVK